MNAHACTSGSSPRCPDKMPARRPKCPNLYPPQFVKTAPLSERHKLLLPKLLDNRVQHLNRLTCFRNFGTTELGGSLFWWSIKITFFLCFGAGDGNLGMLTAVLPPTSPPSCPLEWKMRGVSEDQYLHDTSVAACVFSPRAQTTPLSEQQYVNISARGTVRSSIASFG